MGKYAHKKYRAVDVVNDKVVIAKNKKQLSRETGISYSVILYYFTRRETENVEINSWMIEEIVED